MPTKTNTITAQSRIGWASLGQSEPYATGTIKTIPCPPDNQTVKWFVGIRGNRGVRWWPIISVAQIGPTGVINGASTTPENIQGDILDFLWDFHMQVQYETPKRKGKGGRPKEHGERIKVYEIQLTPDAHAAIKPLGFTAVMQQVGDAIASGCKVVAISGDGSIEEIG